MSQPREHTTKHLTFIFILFASENKILNLTSTLVN